jgi:hypothetical protein
MLGEIITAYRNNRERAETQATQYQEEDGSRYWIQRLPECECIQHNRKNIDVLAYS